MKAEMAPVNETADLQSSQTIPVQIVVAQGPGCWGELILPSPESWGKDLPGLHQWLWHCPTSQA